MYIRIALVLRVAAKEEAEEEGKKKKGGIVIPEEWPWEEAKKVFAKPDVTPADEIEVSAIYRFTVLASKHHFPW